MPIDYKSYLIEVPASSSVTKKLFSTSKPNNLLSQWTIIIQYLYEAGDPSPLPPVFTLGITVRIIGTANGIPGIYNVLPASQSWVPIVGATYRAYGNEIELLLSNDDIANRSIMISAVEDAAIIMDGESRFADPAVDVNIPQFATMFSVAVVSTGLRQRDSGGAALITAPATPGVWYPLHPMAVSLVDTDAQLQIYSFKKGYT